ncbi:MAG: hypothetical protein QXP31_08885 [Pyrobaculum sp.]
MELDCEVEVNERHIRARGHDEQTAEVLQQSFFHNAVKGLQRLLAPP